MEGHHPMIAPAVSSVPSSTEKNHLMSGTTANVQATAIPAVPSSLAAAPAVPSSALPPSAAAAATIPPPSSSSTKSSSWRVRDAADELLQTRQVLLASAPASTDKGGSRPTMHLATVFEPRTSLARIHRDKTRVVQQAFTLAATAVLDALEKQQHGQGMMEDPQVDVNPQNLPAVLAERKLLSELRVQCLERSHENKEYAKKNKSAKTTETAAAATTSTSSVKTEKRPSSTGTTMTTTTTSGAAANSSSTKPQFTRNTPASSAAALDFRFNSSRAILCAAGNLAFDALTPGPPVDAIAVPQNPSQKSTTTSSSAAEALNMGAVVVEAQTLAQRTISVTQNAVRRSTMRYQYRKDNARYDHECDRLVKNPFAYATTNSTCTSNEHVVTDDEQKEDRGESLFSVVAAASVPHEPNPHARTTAWTSVCLPRLRSVLNTGAGHAIYHDVHWATRHGRMADLLQSLASDKNANMGPHLIVCTQPEVNKFAQEFYDMSQHLRLITANESKQLNALVYRGSKKHRRSLRRYFPQGTGLPEAPFHVIVTSYDLFLQDYFHFCQLPFEVVVLDDGANWMAVAQVDQNSAIGSIWDGAIWSKNDHHVGLAGPSAATQYKEWDFSKDDLPDSTIKEALIGLTARHRIMTSSTLRMQNRQSVDLVPVSGLINFVAPQFADVVREEWDRSKITSDASSMEHYRTLVARSTVVHHSAMTETDMDTLAMNALKGQLPSPDRVHDPLVPQIVSDDTFVSKGMIAFSRRSCLAWLGPPDRSWLRYELGTSKLKHILDAMKVSSSHGPFCEEITTASSTTSSGATGQVAGTMAYRCAVRCNRHFGSEQGLRQHVSALHAPSGTWLCRTCGSDCITSQARTHHERSCGQPTGGAGSDPGGTVGATPTVGQGGPAKSGVGKKKAKTSKEGPAPVEEKDPDGSFRIPGYRGVWVNTSGKHFVKIDGERLKGNDDILLFDNIDDAARKHDEVIKAKNEKGKKVELNFKPDGSRVLYEDITPASTSGLGSNVVPQLSRINIKDLPPDVKPLLRDPRQTSRTGGNSKRHVYAYRGVCRQARKGHDRWQSQISFMGVNHYLGTFDSEWDAAAIYAWAHLILYGEEATKQAQKEGEEAAAAYEQEKRDIAAGKIPEAPPKPEKKKKPKKEKKTTDKADGAGGDTSGGKSSETKKRKTPGKGTPGSEKKARSGAKTARGETIAPILAKGVAKAPILAPREFDEVDDLAELQRMTGLCLTAARGLGYCVSDVQGVPSTADPMIRPCVPVQSSPAWSASGGAMLLGLSPSVFGWDMEEFVAKSGLPSEQATMTAIQMLAVEYDDDGVNARFQTMVQSTVCIIGNASSSTQKCYRSLGLGAVPVGGPVGELDCHIGGVPGSCSEKAACLLYAPTSVSDYQFSCLFDDDIVTLNGQRVQRAAGSFPLYNEDIITVGARVFVFLLPPDSKQQYR